MSHVFISYSRKDMTTMKRIRDELRAAGVPLWTDEKLTPGTPSWRNSIEKALENAAAVVVLMSPDSKHSQWVERELGYAGSQHVRVYPVLIAGTEQNAIPLELANSQWTDLRNDFSVLQRQLIPALKNHLERYPQQVAQGGGGGTALMAQTRPVYGAMPDPANESITRELASLFNFNLQDLERNRQGIVTRGQNFSIHQKRMANGQYHMRDGLGCIGWMLIASGAVAVFNPSSMAMGGVLLVIGLLMLGYYAMAFFRRDAHVSQVVGHPERVRLLGLLGIGYKIEGIQLPRSKNNTRLQHLFKTHTGKFRVYYVHVGREQTAFLSMEALD